MRVMRNWARVQTAMVVLAVCLGVALLVWPRFGLHAFWNVLIPAAPALVVLAPGLWRNICPLGTTSQMPRRLAGRRGVQINSRASQWLGLGSVLVLLIVVPLRHVWFNTSGPATFTLLLIAAVVAVVASIRWSGKSGWCASLCPIHAVERLYGGSPAVTVTSGHCQTCVRCTTPCPDTAPGARPGMGSTTRVRTMTAMLMFGGFPGFVWGWFQVPDGTQVAALQTWAWPFGGLLATLTLYLILRRSVSPRMGRRIDVAFACAAVSCYYWFRLPSLIGYGPFPGDGMLINLRHIIPVGFVPLVQLGPTIFFVWWMVIRRQAPKPWMFRPPVETTAPPAVSMVTIGAS